MDLYWQTTISKLNDDIKIFLYQFDLNFIEYRNTNLLWN